MIRRLIERANDALKSNREGETENLVDALNDCHASAETLARSMQF